MNSAVLPSWLVADLRRSQPSVAGSAPVAQVFAATLRAAGITTAIDANESAHAMIRVNEVPVSPLGVLDMEALHREVDLASDYVAAFPADGFDARKASSNVQKQAHLVAAIAGPRPCLVYARPAVIARNSANLDTTALLSRVAAAELQGRRSEMRHDQAVAAAASAWSELRDCSESVLRLNQDLQRLAAEVQRLTADMQRTTDNMQRQAQDARKLADAVALAERLLRGRGEDHVAVIPVLGLFRKRRADERSSPAGGDPPCESLADIASLLRQARADWAAGAEPPSEDQPK